MIALWGALGLRRKILLLVTVGLLVIFGVLGRLGYQAIQDLQQLVFGERLTLAQMLAADIDRAIEHSGAELEDVARLLGRSQALPDLESTQAELQRAFRHLTNQHHWITTRPVSLSLADPSGRLLLSFGSAPVAPEVASRRSEAINEALRIGTRVRKEVVFAGATLATPPRPLVSVAVPVANRDRQIVGALVVDLEAFPQLQKGDPSGQERLEGYAIQIIDAQGLVLAGLAPGGYPGTPSQLAERFSALIASQKAQTIRVPSPEDAQHQGHVAAFAPVKSVPWGIIVEREGDVAVVLPQQLQTQFLLLGGIALVVAVFVAWVTTGWVVRPIQFLIEASRRIAGGHLEETIVVPGKDEVASLAQALDEMRTQLLASRAAIEERNRILGERMQRRTQELSAFYEVSQALASAREHQSLGDAFLAKTQVLFPHADVGALFLYRPEEGVLKVRASFGLAETFAQQDQTLPPDFCAWQAFYSGQARLCSVPELPPGVLRALSLADETALQAQGKRGMCVPLVYGGRPIGSLVLYQFRHPRAFTQEDMELLQALANQAALAIENARLAQEASKVEALQELDRIKTEFVARASHELRTPLTSIKSLAETLLRRDIALREGTQREFLEGIDRAADRLANIITDLLTVSRIESGKLEIRPQALDLACLVERVVSQFCRQDPTHTFEVSAPHDLPPAWADPDKVEDVLNNLLSNAVKYAPVQTVITIAIQQEERGSLPHAASEKPESPLVVSVRDRGAGIPRSQFGKLFQRFSRVDSPISRTVGGVGLGLYICRSYVEAMEGEIWVESSPGEGATFSFALPLAQRGPVESQGTPDTEAPGLSHDMPSLEGMCLLVVDDEPDLRRTVRLHLEAVGCQVLCAPSAKKAGELLQRYHPDAIILDIVLPGCSGFELVESLQAQASTRSIPIILLTAKAQEEDERRARELGAYAFIKKPFSTEHLHRALAQLLAQQERQSPPLISVGTKETIS